MLRYISGEAGFYRLFQIFENFQMYMNLLYPSDIYEIVYQNGGETHTVNLKAVDYNSFGNEIGEHLSGFWMFHHSNEPYSYKVLGNGVALMDFASCEAPEKMGIFADSMVANLKKHNIKDLIIDLRLNGGGNSAVGDSLLRRISSVPFMSVERVSYKVTPTSQKLLREQRSWKDLEIGYYSKDYIGPEYLQQPLPEPQRFNGRVWMLISHATFSAGVDCAIEFKKSHIGKIIGQETGGMNACYIDCLDYRLPHSSLDCNISYKHSIYAGGDEGHPHGVLPDYEVSAQDALEYTLKLINTKQ